MDWSSLERKNLNKKSQEATFQIPVKKVAVTKDQVRKLPDGTVIITDKKKSVDK